MKSQQEWIITRHLVEKMCGFGETREEAMKDAQDPFSITIIKETCVRLKEKKHGKKRKVKD